MADTEEHWVTINGTHILLKGGESPKDAIERKFGDSESMTDRPKSLSRNPETSHKQYQKLKDTYEGYAPPEDGKQTIMGYTGGEFRHYNTALRKGETSDRIVNMKETINKAPEMPPGILMYRGVGFETASRISDAPIGSIIEDKGFQSFSESPDVATKFTSSPKGVDQPILLRVVTKGGEKGISTMVTGSAHMEDEIILQAGSKWRIANKEVIKYKGTWDTDTRSYNIVDLVKI